MIFYAGQERMHTAELLESVVVSWTRQFMTR